MLVVLTLSQGFSGTNSSNGERDKLEIFAAHRHSVLVNLQSAISVFSVA